MKFLFSTSSLHTFLRQLHSNASLRAAIAMATCKSLTDFLRRWFIENFFYRIPLFTHTINRLYERYCKDPPTTFIMRHKLPVVPQTCNRNQVTRNITSKRQSEFLSTKAKRFFFVSFFWHRFLAFVSWRHRWFGISTEAESKQTFSTFRAFFKLSGWSSMISRRSSAIFRETNLEIFFGFSFS